MNLDESVSLWIDGLREGDEQAAQLLWERYFTRLVHLAGKKLPSAVRRDFDEEDVALSAFHSLCQGIQDGRFPQLDDRDNLWSLLVVITGRKAMRRMRHAMTQKRGSGRVRGESALVPFSEEPGQADIDQIIGKEPTAEFALKVSEECQRLLDMLPDDDMRRLALLKMEGYTNEESAELLDCGLRTVQRRLGLIRKIWETRS